MKSCANEKLSEKTGHPVKFRESSRQKEFETQAFFLHLQVNTSYAKKKIVLVPHLSLPNIYQIPLKEILFEKKAMNINFPP